MATADYERLLDNAGFARATQSEALATKTRPWGARTRTTLSSAAREENGARIDVQLQEVWINNRRGLSGVARIERPGITGTGDLRARPIYGAVQSILSAPKLALAILIPLLCAGVWVVMVPGFLVIMLLIKMLQRGDPIIERPELASPKLGWRYSVWGADTEAARAAIPIALQDTVIDAKWFGYCEVRDGEILLEAPIGWGRYDLFAELITLAQLVARLK